MKTHNLAPPKNFFWLKKPKAGTTGQTVKYKLRKRFPAIKFSVRSRHITGEGRCIYVAWAGSASEFDAVESFARANLDGLFHWGDV